MSKKWISILLAVVLLAATFSTVFAEAAPGTCPHNRTVKVGRQGFFSTNPDFACQTNARRVNASAAPVPSTLKFVRPLLRLESKTVQPASVVFSGKTSVFFDLNKNQEKAWKAGVLAIYFYNPNLKTWTKLSSSSLPMKGSAFRIGSPIYQYGLYGLAKSD
jgi:hypothetical protein